MVPERWKKGPRPDPDVVELLERLAVAARKGHIRALVVVTLDPLLKVTPECAGDMDNVRSHLLVGGMFRAATQLTNGPDPRIAEAE
jgi:hypothetical protein